MGTSKSTSNTQTGSTTTNTPSALEQGFDQSLNNLWDNNQGMISGITGAGGSLAQSLLSGSSLPGTYNGSSNGGSSLYGVDSAAQQNIINQSMRTLPTSLQATGMLDSGASDALYQRGAQNVGAQLAQFNTTAQQGAANLGSSLGMAAMQPSFSAASMLSSLLPGLRTTTSSGYQNTQNTATQPLSQTIGQLSSASGNNTGIGNAIGGITGSQQNNQDMYQMMQIAMMLGAM